MLMLESIVIVFTKGAFVEPRAFDQHFISLTRQQFLWSGRIAVPWLTTVDKKHSRNQTYLPYPTDGRLFYNTSDGRLTRPQAKLELQNCTHTSP